MGDKQSQKSGDSSVNIQGRDISFGLSYSETRKVAMDVFQDNFYKFRDEAAEIVEERAKDFVENFLKKAHEEGFSAIPEAKNPDFQYALFSAQREYARTGNRDLGKTLVQLLVDRTKVTDRNLTQIVLNESLTIAPKLTPDQLDALSLVFLIKYTRNTGLLHPEHLLLYLDKYILPFVNGASRKQSAYQHLEFAGCGTISIGELKAEDAFHRTYPGLFSEGFTEEEVQDIELSLEERSRVLIICLHNDLLLQVNAVDDETVENLCLQSGIESEKVEKLKRLQASKVMPSDKVKDYLLNARPYIPQFFEVWEDTNMKHMSLTSVGIAIAHANIQRKVGETFDLSIWL